MQAQGRKSVNIESRRILKLYSWKKKRSILGISYRLFEQLSGAQKTGSVDEMGKSFTSFLELFNTICLVRPTFAASIESTKFSRDLPRNQGRKSNGEKWKWNSLASSNGKVVDDKEKHATEVKAQIAPFVHVYKGSVLQDSLPGLRNSVVVLHPTPLQERFHKRIQVVKELFRYENLEALISFHPSLLLKEDAFSADQRRLQELKLNPDAGVKAKFVMELIRLSDALKEKVLVFSQYIDPLKLTRDLLKSQFQWTEGEEVLYMDGKSDMKQRQSSMKVFNDPCCKAKVLLASTKACSEGISLVGASRVVSLDVTWNPSVERQAISRAYRLGQKKVVFVYHLLMDRTNEEHKVAKLTRVVCLSWCFLIQTRRRFLRRKSEPQFLRIKSCKRWLSTGN
ncbi:SNF2 domain-containing protein CLASSY 4 [Prunus yedoensis var. nudiflora]|uniref:SNF2 domain-containing protein CLASSY 4 n=1 Tax=Prunus yedoensis var. nudiflora TaxID=2094558 RepID=A0A314Z5F6_PRUYE|nr:SNF2 domain-containing protein CLASSY 4 [Prunus yedoensis var. nudiflora]